MTCELVVCIHFISQYVEEEDKKVIFLQGFCDWFHLIYTYMSLKFFFCLFSGYARQASIGGFSLV